MKINFKNIIQFWQLTFNLAKINFKIKTEDSYLGIFWHFLNPLLLFVTMYFIFKNITGQTIANYPVYLLSGIIMFRFFQSTTGEATTAVINAETVIKSLKFNLFAVPFSVVLSNTFSHLIEILTVIAFLTYLNVISIEILYYPLILALLILFTTGLALFFSALATVFRDTINIWSNLLRIIWLATPIFYSVDVNPLLRKINLTVNPMFYFIEMLRTVIIKKSLPSAELILPTLIFTGISLLVGILTFNILQKKFSENL